MEQVTHSPFLQALGYALINSLWQFALLWLVYVSLNTAIKLTSHQKYTAGLVIQLSGFSWFAVTLFFYYRQCLLFTQRFVLFQQYNFTFNINSSLSGREKFLVWITGVEHFLPYLSIAYLALLLFLSLKWLQAYKYTQGIKITGLQKIEAEWRVFVQQLALQLGISKPVKIYLSEIIQTPLTIGFLKPLILIPIASINHLSKDQIEAVILHELAHIKRFDYLYNLLLAFIEAALFFNPFMLLISRHIKRERENCCDDWVMQYEYSPASYARALLKIATFQSSLAPVLAMKAADEKHALLNRIKRMLEKNEKSFFNYRHQVMALFVIMTVVIVTSVISSNGKIKKTIVTSSNPKNVFEPIVANVDNPLFNPVFFLAKAEKYSAPIESKPAKTAGLKQLVNVDVPASKTAEEPPVTASEVSLAPLDFTEETTREVAAPQPTDEDVLITPTFGLTRFDIVQPVDAKIAGTNLEKKLTKAITEKEQAEKKLRRLAMLINDRPVLSVDKEHLIKEIYVTLKKFRVANRNIEAVRLRAPLAESNVESEDVKDDDESDAENQELFEKENYKILLNDVEPTIDEFSKQPIHVLTDPEDFNFNLNFNTKERTTSGNSHAFSFEFKERSERKAKCYVAPHISARQKSKKQCRVSTEPITEQREERVILSPQAPAAPETKIYKTTRRAYIIKI